MRTFKFALIAFVALTFQACSSDSDSKPARDYGETTGDYLPMADNNTWNFDDGMNPTSVSLQFAETRNSVDIFRMYDTAVEEIVPVFIHKRGASYIESTEDATVPVGNGFSMFMSAYEVVILRDDLAVGETWTESPDLEIRLQGNGQNQELTASMTYTGEILERDATEIIGGETYTQVIKSSLSLTQNINGQITELEAEYWFAKDVGIIKTVNWSSLDNMTTERYLVDYNLN